MKAHAIVLAGLLMASQAVVADFFPGQSPFVNFQGSGLVEHNADGYGEGFAAGCMRNSYAYAPWCLYGSGYLTYTETWDQAQVLGTLLLISPLDQYRSSAGNVYVARDPQAGNWELVDTFDMAGNMWGLHDLNETSVYGVRIEVNGVDMAFGNAYQIGGIGFFAERLTDVAYGKPTIAPEGIEGTLSSNQWPGSYGNMTNWNLANANGERFLGTGNNQYVGVDFETGIQLQGLLISTCTDAPYAFGNFDVQVFRNGGWDSLGGAVQPYGDDLFWIDFGLEGEYAEQVRLFGNADNKVVYGIMAFAVVPEPATMSLLVVGGLALLRRRK